MTDPSHCSSSSYVQSSFSKCEPRACGAAQCLGQADPNTADLSVATHSCLAELVPPSPEGPSGHPGPPHHWGFPISELCLFSFLQRALQGIINAPPPLNKKGDPWM